MALVVSDGWSFDPNLKWVTNPEEVVLAVSAALLSAGWTILNRGDGTNLISDGTPHVLADWQNVDAYEHYRDPSGAGGREITLEWNNVSGVRLYQGRAGIVFTGETAGAAPTAPAADWAQYIGTSGNYDTSFINNATYNHHFAANSVPQGSGANTYAWYWIVRSPASAFRRTGVEPVDSPAGAADTEPYMAWTGTTASLASSLGGWYKAGLSGSVFIPTGMAFDTFTNRDGDNPYVTGFDLPDMYVYDNTGGVVQTKGRCINLRAEGLTSHVTGDDYELTEAADARALFDTVAVRWAVNVAPVIT